VIGSLRGTFADRATTELTLEVGGVGYRVQMTPRDLVGIGDPGAEVHVWVHHHRREDAETLYGFPSRDERDLFEVLIGTHGVGPALGLAILAVHTPRALRLALATDDLAALCLVPGVGRKTAARLLMELKSRMDLGDVDLTDRGGSTSTSPAARSAHADVRDALGGLGYSADEISACVRELPVDGDPAELLRLALRRLAAA